MKCYVFFLIATIAACQIEIYLCSPTGLFYILPDDSPNASCPSQACATLSQCLLNISGISLSNIQFVFLSGTHILTSNITMQHVLNITMVGIDNLTPAVIFCHSATAIIGFLNSSSVTIANLVFENCGGHVPKLWYGKGTGVVAATYFSTCYHCSVKNVTFIGYGLVVNNLIGESYLNNITVHLRKTAYILPWQPNQGIEILNHEKCLYHSLIYVSKINIAYSSMCSNGQNSKFCLYDVGIHIHLQPNDCNTTVVLKDSKFNYKNYINTQYLLKIVLFPTKSSRIMLSIEDCTFQYNNYATAHSNLERPMLKIVISCINVTLIFVQCNFNQNNNNSPLISVSVHDDLVSLDDRCSFPPSCIQIKQSNFIKNISPLVKIQGNSKSKCITRFSIIGPLKVMDNDGAGKDIISIYNVIADVIGEATFISNSNARNIMLFYSCIVTFHKDIAFLKNGFSYAGNVYNIITLQSDFAYIIVKENTNITFLANIYQVMKIKVVVQKYTPYPFCVFQYDTLTSKTVTHALLKQYDIRFFYDHKVIRSHVNEDNSSIQLSINYYTFHCQWLPKSIFDGYHPADIYKQIIQTDDKNMYQHTRVCYCFMNNTYDCSLDLLGPVFPGQVLQVDLCVPHESDKDEIFTLYIDTHNKFLPNSACKVAHQSQLISTISRFSKTYNFTIVSNFTTECELFLTAQPDLYRRYDAFYVQLLPCPIGFKLQNGVCNCDPILSIITDECYIDYSTIRRPANYWIVAHTQTNNTKYLISICPMDYCLPYSSSVNLLHSDLQCQFNRTGILCSQCPHPLSMVFASSNCMKCTNVHILITIIVIVAGIVLVVLLYVLNLTVTNGTINGIIFYANIVSINDSVFLVTNNVFKPLRVFISFTNLDLGIETCFYNGMDSYAKMWLQLFFPSYLIIIAVSIIIASRYSTRILRFTYTRSLPVLATLFLLSYTGVLRTVLTVLFSYSTITHLPSGHQQIVWSINASVPLFGLKFTILFITCLVLFLILIPFNATLLFTRYFLRFKVINRFKPLLDAFQGSYKDKYYYWVAVHLNLRSLLFAFYAFPTKLKLIFSTMLLISLGFYTGYIHPNKNKMVNIQELLLLLNLTIMYAVSYQGDIFFIVTNIMISLAFVQFGTIVMYHFLTYTCHCDITYMLRIAKEKLMTCNKMNLSSDSNDIALLNIPERTYNYTEYRDGLVSDDFQ